jgi:retinol dehydrogenase 12
MGNSSSNDSKYSPKTTSVDIAKEFGSNARDKFVIVTGANSGIGFETTKILVKEGAKVVLACRSQKNGDEAIEKIKKEIPEADVIFLALDLSSLTSVREFAAAYRETNRPLHYLINNAGVMACPFSTTKDGFETQFGVNHIGHFLLTLELFPILESTGTIEQPARVVNLSSIANYWVAPKIGIDFDDIHAKQSYNMWYRYGSSKMANILFSDELQRRCSSQNKPVISLSLHPGSILETNLARHQGISFITGFLSVLFENGVLNNFCQEPQKTIPEGAATTLYCTLSPDVIPGGYYSHCQEEKILVNPKSHDPELAAKLWEVSLELVGLSQSPI